MKRVPKLITGRMKGAEHVNLQGFARTKGAVQYSDFLTMRYYPATTTLAQGSGERARPSLVRAPYRRQLGDHHKPQHLSDKLCISFITPVASTSRSSVVRHKMVRRLREVLRRELLHRHRQGRPDALPERAMHLVMSPRGTNAAFMPWPELYKQVVSSYDAARQRFDRMESRVGKPITTRGFPHDPKDKRQRRMMDETDVTALPVVRNVRDSGYTRSSGGVASLVRHMLGKR